MTAVPRVLLVDIDGSTSHLVSVLAGLHPTTDPANPNYLKNYGSVEIVSGSFNGMIDIQSGLQLLRSHAGGTGSPLPEDVVRATLAIRLNQLAVEHINSGHPLIKAISPKTTKGVLGKQLKYGVADSSRLRHHALLREPCNECWSRHCRPCPCLLWRCRMGEAGASRGTPRDDPG